LLCAKINRGCTSGRSPLFSLSVFFFFLGFVFYVLRLNLGWMRGTKLRAAAFKMTGVGSFVLYSNSNIKIFFFFFFLRKIIIVIIINMCK
jgi:hypothetical protein